MAQRSMDLNPLDASGRIQDALEARGWRLGTPFPKDLVRQILSAGGVPDPVRLAASVPGAFLTANSITRADVEGALGYALSGVRVVEKAPRSGTTQIFNGNVEIMEKKIEINTGQFAGNADSPKGRVRVDRQQQVQVTPAEERALREHLDDAEVQEALALHAPADEKKARLAGVLAKVAGVPLDKATDFAAKVVANTTQPG